MEPYLTLGSLSVPTFTALIAGAVALGLAALAVAARRRAVPRPLHWIDAGLGGLVGGVIGARLFHVLLSAAYFKDHVGEAFDLRTGGLSWHGAVCGGLLGAWLVCRWRRVDWRAVTDVLALVWPAGVMAAWAGCWASACAYGAEVWTLAEHPAWAVSERPDIYGAIAPRYNVQLFGVWFGAALLALLIGLALAGWLRGYRLWLALGLTGAGAFILGFFRGDGVPAPLPGLSRDQALDLSLIAFSVAAAAVTRLSRRAH